MIYLSGALIIIAVLFTVRPPTFTFRKVMVVEQPTPTSTAPQEGPTEDELKKAYEDAPPNLDELVESINQVIYDLQGDD